MIAKNSARLQIDRNKNSNMHFPSPENRYAIDYYQLDSKLSNNAL